MREVWRPHQDPLCMAARDASHFGDCLCKAHLSVLLVVADEVSQLLLAAVQRGVQLLHLAGQVTFLPL